MKLIALEEHFLTPAIRAAWAASPIGAEGTDAFDRGDLAERLDDLGPNRIALMDEAGIDVQVLSVTTPALHNLDAAQSTQLATQTNDLLAAAIAQNPTRFQGFATLPTAAPQQAADELDRCITRLGFNGTMLCGRTRDKHLDHPDFHPLFATVAKRNAPVYIHPQIPQQPVREALYGGLGEPLSTAFAAFGLGWHYEAGIQFVRLVLAGTFDRHPDLQIILGHWGEVVLFYLERIQNLARVTKLDRPIADYFKQNLYVTPSGMWSPTYLQHAVDILGPERILFSVDYPYQYKPGGGARTFLNEAPLTPANRELFAHGNWDRLTQAITR